MEQPIRHEIRFVGICVLAGSILLGLILWPFGLMSEEMLVGILIGAAASVLNFQLLAVSASLALNKGKPRRAQLVMGVSYAVRMLLLAGILCLALVSPQVHALGVVIPLLFPNAAIILRAIFGKEGYGWKDRKLSS